MFTKLALYFKLYGGYVLFAIMAAVSIILVSRDNALLNQLALQSESYRRQLEELSKIREQEQQRHRLIEKTYQETLDRIEKERNSALENLDQSKRDQIRAIIEETHDNPTAMAQRINSLLGIPVY